MLLSNVCVYFTVSPILASSVSHVDPPEVQGILVLVKHTFMALISKYIKKIHCEDEYGCRSDNEGQVNSLTVIYFLTAFTCYYHKSSLHLSHGRTYISLQLAITNKAIKKCLNFIYIHKILGQFAIYLQGEQLSISS